MKKAIFPLALLFAAADAGTDKTLEPTQSITRPPEPTSGQPSPSPISPFPTEQSCVCEDLGYVAIDGVCSRGCGIDQVAEFDSLVECCASVGFSGGSLPGCPVNDACGTPFPTPAPTLAPCNCEELDFVNIGGVCSRGCSLDEDGEFDSVEECCASIGFVDGSLPNCPVNDECGTPFPNPSPITPFPTESTPAPTPAPCNCEELNFVNIGGVCSRGCSLDEAGEFADVFDCCASLGFAGDGASGCPVFDECGTPFPTPMPTPAPTPCDCSELDFVVVDGFCSRGCSVDEAGEFDSVEECCASIGFEGPMMLPGCPVFDECPVGPKPDPCPSSTGKSGKSGAKSTSGDMSMGFIDCFTSSSSKSGKSGSKGGKSGGYGHSGGKGGKSGGGSPYMGSGHSDKGGKSGGGHSDKGGKSSGYDGYYYEGGYNSSSSYSGKGGKSGGGHSDKGGKYDGGHSDKGGKSGGHDGYYYEDGYGSSSSYSGKGGKSGGGHSDKGGKSNGYDGYYYEGGHDSYSSHSGKGGKAFGGHGHKGGKSGGGGSSDGYGGYSSSFDGYGHDKSKAGNRRLAQEARANLRATANRK